MLFKFPFLQQIKYVMPVVVSAFIITIPMCVSGIRRNKKQSQEDYYDRILQN